MSLLEFQKNKVVGIALINKELTENDIETIIVGGLEGGINYWGEVDREDKFWSEKPKDIPSSQWATKIVLDGETIYFYDIEDEDKQLYPLTLEKLINGYVLNAKERSFDADIENGDANTYDCIIQYALFGEIVFG